ncbi:MAG: M23 family peptidase, partial [Bacteroidetes bacterium]
EKELLMIQEQEESSYRRILEADPLPESIKNAGFGGVNAYKNYEGMLNSDLLISTAKRIDILSKKLTVQSKSFDELILLAKEREKRLAVIPSIFPLYESELQKVGSGFGMRKHPILRRVKMHKGIDLVAKRGAKIMSSGKGVVKSARYNMGYGKCVKIDHGYGYVSVYAHMSKIKVKKGQTVSHGDLIGLVGNTGRSTGPHLHYEVWINGKAVNPESFYIRK